MIQGIRDLPDHLLIGDTCKNNHGIDGKSIRYKKSSKCALCQHQASRKFKRKVLSVDNRDLSALQEFNDRRRAAEDYDPLFDPLEK
jgi:hypothetical protein